MNLCKDCFGEEKQWEVMNLFFVAPQNLCVYIVLLKSTLRFDWLRYNFLCYKNKKRVKTVKPRHWWQER